MFWVIIIIIIQINRVCFFFYAWYISVLKWSFVVLLLNCWHKVPAVTAECLSLLFGKLKPCIFLSFIVLWLAKSYFLEGNAQNINIDKIGFHIRRPLTTVANRKCCPENNTISPLFLRKKYMTNPVFHMGAQWLSGRVLDSRPRGRGFEPHRRHCVVSLSKNINTSLVLVQPRKTRPFITERLLMGHKESNHTIPVFHHYYR